MKQKRRPFVVKKTLLHKADSAQGFRISNQKTSNPIKIPIITTIVILGLSIGLFSGIHAFFSDVIGDNLNATTATDPGDTWDFECTNAVQPWTVPRSGSYQLETWGAQGGGNMGGMGGYAIGTVELTQGQTLYVYVGCQGQAYTTSGTTWFNGPFGGGGGVSTDSYSDDRGTTGGGASDIRIDTDSLYARVIVGGGGGGAGLRQNNPRGGNTPGGFGGGLVGGAGTDVGGWSTWMYGLGGTQSAGGAIQGSSNSAWNGYFATPGSFGLGGGGTGNSAGGAGGGGGWYGGGGGNINSGGGGSSWTYTSASATNTPIGWLLTPQFHLTDDDIIAGNQLMPDPGGGSQTTGRAGDGFVRITELKAAPIVEFLCDGSIQDYNVPVTGNYIIEAWGAQGGMVGAFDGFEGAYSISYVTLTQGDTLKVLPGCKGGFGAGGGGSFVTTSSNSPLAVAGGGGGRGGLTNTASATMQTTGFPNNYGQAGQNGGSTHLSGGGTGGNGGNTGISNGQAPGGGGLLSNGTDVGSNLTGGKAFINGGAGGLGSGTALNSPVQPPGNGGFGGGGGGYNNNGGGYFRGGGGGGYSGGQGGTYDATQVTNSGGGGGGSFFTGSGGLAIAGNATMPSPSGGTQVGQPGNGFIRITTPAGSNMPVITLLGNNPLTVNLGTAFVDPGATATDPIDGDITSSIVLSLGSLNTSVAGTYTITYSVTNSSSQTATKTRTVIVQPPTYNFVCTNGSQPWTVPTAGLYKLEVWGAQGGSYDSTYEGGKGGYSVGEIVLSTNEQLFIYVGCQGNGGSFSGGHPGGFNGGGSTTGSGSGGGGASDIRIATDSLFSRVIVGGGGGGSSYGSPSLEGFGGGLSGGNTSRRGSATGGTQTAPGVTTPSSSSYNQWSPAVFGLGGSITGGNITGGGGGGGGWYGGGAGPNDFPSWNDNDDTAGAGGSGYVYTSSTASSVPGGWLLDSSNYLSNASTTAGNLSMPAPGGSTQVGQLGDGFVRITQLKPAPTITIQGANPYDLNQGSSYVDPGVTASDPIDGDITSSITINTTGLNINVLGTYTVTYSVTNSLGVTVTATRTVNVIVAARDFACTQGMQSWTIPATGSYLLEVWGANGGEVSTSTVNGKGGYSKGIVNFTAGETVYVYVGCKGEESIVGNYINAGGFNGGGAAKNSSSTGTSSARTGGGGATDIRVVADNINNRIIVAGGGSGNSGHSSGQIAGNGGGTTGANGSFGTGGSQTAGGSDQVPSGSCPTGYTPAGFGIGGACTSSTVGGGGGGWYGGGNGNGGGGGSGYVLTAISNKPSGYFTQNTNYYLSNALTVSLGTFGFITNPASNGDGYAKITFVP